MAITRIAIPIKDATDFNVRGLGRFAATIKTHRVFSSQGFRWHFDPALAFCYARLPGGAFNERETHSFLQFVLGKLDRSVTFVDVGSNFGEFVVPMAAHPRVERVIAYEPDPRTAEMCRRNLSLNDLQADVRERLVGDGTAIPYVIDILSPSESGMGQGGPLLPTHRLDDEIPPEGSFLLLIDVEGSELAVLRGASELIRKTRPLIVFEYNLVTRKHFTLSDAQAQLPGYDIYRLRRDGQLDRKIERNTWNCVAVPAGTPFEAICQARIRP